MKSVEDVLPARRFKAIVIPALAIAVVGVCAWVYQIVVGMDATGMSDANPWGLYLMSFMFTVGIAVGALAVATVPRLWGSSAFAGLSKLGAWVAVCASILSIGLVTIDLGGPLRVWELFVYSNFASPLMWDIFVLPVFLIVAVLYLVTLVRAEAGKASSRSVKIVAGVALVAAIALCVVDAWIFGLLPGRALWNTALLVPWFAVSAVVSGLAVMMVLVFLLKGSDALALPADALNRMGRVLAVALLADLLCLLGDVMVGSYGIGLHADAMNVLFSGALAPVFWIEVAAAVIAIVLLLARKAPCAIAAAALLALVSVFCKRVQFMISGFLDMQAPYPGIETAGFVNTIPLATPMYVPSFVELGVTVAVLSLGVALVVIGLRKLPLFVR